MSPIRKSFEQMLAKRDYALKDSYAPLRGYDGFLKLAKDAGFAPNRRIDMKRTQSYFTHILCNRGKWI
jgi:hypothetical protein